MRRHRISDEPLIAHGKHVERVARLDASTEGIDRVFRATRGSVWAPKKRLVWSPALKRQVWWERTPAGKWIPQGVEDRAVVRKLRVEVANEHDRLVLLAQRQKRPAPMPEGMGLSVEEILDVLDEDDARGRRDLEDEDKDEGAG